MIKKLILAMNAMMAAELVSRMNLHVLRVCPAYTYSEIIVKNIALNRISSRHTVRHVSDAVDGVKLVKISLNVSAAFQATYSKDSVFYNVLKDIMKTNRLSSVWNVCRDA